MRIKFVFTSLRNGFTNFRNGLSIIFGKPKKGAGDRKLAKMCGLVTAQIPTYGKNTVRSQVIKGIEKDLKRTAKKGGKNAVEKLIQNAVGTPEYVQLIHGLGLDESHIRVIAMGVLKKYEK